MRTVVPTISLGGFDACYRAEYARTVRLARLLTGSAGVAEDLAQEAFLRGTGTPRSSTTRPGSCGR